MRSFTINTLWNRFVIGAIYDTGVARTATVSTTGVTHLIDGNRRGTSLSTETSKILNLDSACEKYHYGRNGLTISQW
ncbi:hypothetical protein KPH14_012792 [Odynerus spinipes]|uniref:Uncharacterized protein n=1 Tax=Odynerus spinipes TaxID=1348599 RepID=A0AAD9RG66_9HYME|nr:hypothetical protein KPH14_012792 [Odynerus spinipes]